MGESFSRIVIGGHSHVHREAYIMMTGEGHGTAIILSSQFCIQISFLRILHQRMLPSMVHKAPV